MKKTKISILFGVICCVLAIAISVQVKTIDEANKEVGKTTSGNDRLRDEVLQLREKYNNKYKELEEAESKLEQVRTQAVADNEEDAEKEKQIKQMEKLLGKTEVKGEGIVIVLDDNRDISADEVLNVGDYIVHYYDLMYITNELFNAGATAVSINNQRVTTATGIMCDGNITRVNGEMVGVPITIKAIGFPEMLEGQLTRTGGYLEYLGNYVKIEVQKSNDITIPKFDGVYATDYIK